MSKFHLCSQDIFQNVTRHVIVRDDEWQAKKRYYKGLSHLEGPLEDIHKHIPSGHRYVNELNPNDVIILHN